jgi:hypothetical protein
VPTNKEDPVKSADPKGHTVFKALAAINEGRKWPRNQRGKVTDFVGPVLR